MLCSSVVATSLSPDFTRRDGILVIAINETDVCLGTAFMLTSAKVQRQSLTTIVPQVVDISLCGHRGVYIEIIYHREPSIGRRRGRFIIMVMKFVVPPGAFRLVIAEIGRTKIDQISENRHTLGYVPIPT